MMDRRLVRRAAPALYALAILIALLFARAALLVVIIAGAVLLGLLYTLLAGGPGGRSRPGRRLRSR